MADQIQDLFGVSTIYLPASRDALYSYNELQIFLTRSGSTPIVSSSIFDTIILNGGDVRRSGSVTNSTTWSLANEEGRPYGINDYTGSYGISYLYTFDSAGTFLNSHSIVSNSKNQIYVDSSISASSQYSKIIPTRIYVDSVEGFGNSGSYLFTGKSYVLDAGTGTGSYNQFNDSLGAYSRWSIDEHNGDLLVDKYLSVFPIVDTLTSGTLTLSGGTPENGEFYILSSTGSLTFTSTGSDGTGNYLDGISGIIDVIGSGSTISNTPFFKINTSDPVYILDYLPKTSTILYRTRAFDIYGNRSEWNGNVIDTTTSDTVPPAAPTRDEVVFFQRGSTAAFIVQNTYSEPADFLKYELVVIGPHSNQLELYKASQNWNESEIFSDTPSIHDLSTGLTFAKIAHKDSISKITEIDLPTSDPTNNSYIGFLRVVDTHYNTSTVGTNGMVGIIGIEPDPGEQAAEWTYDGSDEGWVLTGAGGTNEAYIGSNIGNDSTVLNFGAIVGGQVLSYNFDGDPRDIINDRGTIGFAMNADTGNTVFNNIIARGTIYAETGSIGSGSNYWTINGSEISASAGGLVLSADGRITGSYFRLEGGTITSDVVIEGALSANSIRTPAGGPYKAIIDESGSAYFESGSIGGWEIYADRLRSPNNTLILSSSGLISASNFIVHENGSMTASQFELAGPGVIRSSVTIEGTVSANSIRTPAGGPYKAIIDESGSAYFESGSIAGWLLSPSQFAAGSTILDDSGNIRLANVSITGSAGDFQKDSSHYLRFSNNTFKLGSAFEVNDGELTASNASIEGDITATHITTTSGTIGGWSIGSSTLTGGSVTLNSSGVIQMTNLTINGSTGNLTKDGTHYLNFSNNKLQLGNDFIVNDGELTASQATILGEITATTITATGSGNIAGWSINASNISAGSTYLDSTGNIRLANLTITGSTGNIQKDSTHYLRFSDNRLRLGTDFYVNDGELTGSSVLLDGGTIGGFSLSNTQINSTNNDLILKSTGQITGSSVLFNGGTIGSWIITSGTLDSATSGPRIQLNKAYNRISIFDAIGEKAVMGYLENLAMTNGSGSWDSNNYGFWAKPGDYLVIDGEVSQSGGDWIVHTDASIKIYDGFNREIIRLGTDTGYKGLFLYDTSGNTMAKYHSLGFTIGNADTTSSNYIDYDGSSLDIDVDNFYLHAGNATDGIILDNNLGLFISGSNRDFEVYNNSSNYLQFKNGILSISAIVSMSAGSSIRWSDVVDDGNIPADNATVGADWNSSLSNIPGDLFYTGSNTIGDITWVSTYLSGEQVISPIIAGNSGYFSQYFQIGNSTNKIEFTGSSDSRVSSNYSAGTSGFLLSGSGYAEFNDVIVRGDIFANNIVLDSGSIGGWTITSDQIYSDGVYLSTIAGSPENAAELRISADGTGNGTTNFIRMYYSGSNDWGIQAKSSGNEIFHFGEVNGSTHNLISGWTITNTTIETGNTSDGITIDSDKGIFISGSNKDFEVYNNSNNYLRYKSGNVSLAGSMTITGGSGIGNLTDAGDLAESSSVDFNTQVYGGTKPENNATVGANWSVNLNNVPGDIFYTGSNNIDDIIWVNTYLSGEQVISPIIAGNSGYFSQYFQIGNSTNKIEFTGSSDSRIQSNYSPGSTGFLISGSGYSEFNNVVVRGDIIADYINASSGTIGNWIVQSDNIQRLFGLNRIMLNAGNDAYVNGILFDKIGAATGEVSFVSMGQLINYNSSSASSDYGLQVRKRISSTDYKHILYIGGTGSYIGGWEVDWNKIYANNMTLSASGDILLNNVAITGSTGNIQKDSTHYLRFSDNKLKLGSAFEVNDGQVTGSDVRLTGGTIGGWNVNAASINSANDLITLGKEGYIEVTDDSEYYAGLSYPDTNQSAILVAGSGSAIYKYLIKAITDNQLQNEWDADRTKFIVRQDGNVSGSDVYFTGGNVGNWFLGPGGITGSSGKIVTSETGARIELDGANNKLNVYNNRPGGDTKTLEIYGTVLGSNLVPTETYIAGKDEVGVGNQLYIQSYNSTTKKCELYLNASTGLITISGSGGTEIYSKSGSMIDTDGYQQDAMKTRQTLLFGYNASLTDNGPGNTVDARTVDGSTNGQGYRMIRPGKVTGISVQYDLTDSSDGGTLTVYVQKNGSNTLHAAQDAWAMGDPTGDYGQYSTSNPFSFVAGDRINVEITLQDDDVAFSTSIDDIAVIVEIET